MKLRLEAMKEYAQKSKLFVLPLLNLPKGPESIGCYLGIKGLNLCDECAFIMLYYNKDANYPKFLKEIENNKFFDFSLTDGEFDIIVFDLSPIRKDYMRIYNGEYSKLSKIAKILIHKSNDEKAMVGINPEYYYKELAELLQHPEEEIKNTELISPPDFENEILSVSEKVYLELTLDYKIPVEIISY
jgi:hypothetical protein